MQINVDMASLEKLYSQLRETGFEFERIRLEADRQVSALLQTWQGEDSQAFRQTFLAVDGLNELSRRMHEDHLSFYRYIMDACAVYDNLAASILESEQEINSQVCP